MNLDTNGNPVEEVTEAFELNELFEDTEKTCEGCKYELFEEDGTEMQCKLLAHMNALAQKKGKEPFNNRFSCSFHEDIEDL